ncbi:MAG: RNA-binding domain-containing protein [Halobacteriaceae archaeon]
MSTYSVDVRITAPINNTEVDDRVVRAVEAVFPAADVTRDGDRLVAETHGLDRFSELLHDQQILDTARAHLRSRIDGKTIEFRLKKQAAFVGVVNFAVGNPDELGDITVRITVHDPSPERFLDQIAAETDEDGYPEA